MFYEDFYGFLVVGNNSCLRGVRVQILLKNNFRIFLARPENFSRIFCEPTKLFWNYFENLQTQTKFRELFFTETIERVPAFCEWVELPHSSVRVWYRAVFNSIFVSGKLL